VRARRAVHPLGPSPGARGTTPPPTPPSTTSSSTCSPAAWGPRRQPRGAAQGCASSHHSRPAGPRPGECQGAEDPVFYLPVHRLHRHTRVGSWSARTSVAAFHLRNQESASSGPSAILTTSTTDTSDEDSRPPLRALRGWRSNGSAWSPWSRLNARHRPGWPNGTAAPDPNEPSPSTGKQTVVGGRPCRWARPPAEALAGVP